MEPRRILVVQLRRIGDIILSGPAIAALKKRYPRAAIHLLVEPPAVDAVKGLPFLDEVIVYDAKGVLDAVLWALSLRRRKYDLVVDLMGNPRTALVTALSGAAVKAGPAHVFHRWAYTLALPQSSDRTYYAAREKLRMLAPLGVKDEECPLPVWPRLAADRPGDPPRNLVGFVPASRKETRRWPAEKYSELGRLLREKHGCEILVLWGPGERALAEEVVKGIGEGARASQETKTLQAAADLISGCRLVVTNCNGPKHIAVALGVPTVTVHGSSDPAAWNPPSPKHLVVRREELACIGCMKNSCPTQLECLRDLPASRVLAACDTLLAGAKALK
jgi:ADP-heptose:LPS heptosyltransferase